MPWHNAAPSLLLLCAQGWMFYEAISFNQPLLYCNWYSKNDNFKNEVQRVCEGTITCGWGDTCSTTTPPTPSPTPAPTPVSTFSPPIDRSWDMNFFANATVTNVANSFDLELSQSYNVSNRAFDVKYYQHNDCKTELLHSISEQSFVRSSDEGMNPGFLKLETTAILNSTEVFSDDRDDIYTGDSSSG